MCVCVFFNYYYLYSFSFFCIELVSLTREGEAVIGGGKQAKGVAGAEAKNRRALGDIGNLVTVRGIDAKANRPITRSFCAQLLANAQAAAKAENNKVFLSYIFHSSSFIVFFVSGLTCFLPQYRNKCLLV